MRKLTGICAVDGCEKPVRRKVWCMAHWRRWVRHGDPLAGGPARIRGSIAERFWGRVGKDASPTGCWEWQGTTSNQGYGMLTFSADGHKKTRTTHRLSWEIHNGPIPDGLWVLHRCDNRKCVRPDHLYVGTAADNARDMWEPGRGRRAVPSRKP